MNEIKQSYLERKDKIENKNIHKNNLDVIPSARKSEKFVTNLVPYEKNESFKVNSVPLDDNPKNFYNYLGEKENPIKTFVPMSNVNAQRNLFTDSFNSDNQKTVKTMVKEKINDGKEKATGKTSDFRAEPSSGQSEERAVREGGETPRTGALPKTRNSNGAVPKR